MQNRVNTYRKLLAQREKKTPCIKYVAKVTAINPKLDKINGQTFEKIFYYLDDIETENMRLQMVSAELHAVLTQILKTDLKPSLFEGAKIEGLKLYSDYSLEIKKEILGGK